MSWSLKGAGPMGAGVAAIAILVIVAAMVVVSVTRPDPEVGEIAVFSDSSMSTVMTEIVDVFHRRSNVRINIHFGPSAELLEEFKNNPGAVDLFLPGDVFYVDQAEGLVEETRSFAWTVPVILVQGGNPEEIETVEDLGRSGLEFAMADPDVTAMGRIIPEILERHGLTMDDIQPNITFTSEAGPELGNAVRLGRVDAAIVWEPVARHVARCEVMPIPPEENIVAELAVGLPSGSADRESAREFMDFLNGRAAQALLEQHHYALTPPEPGEHPPAEEHDDEEITEEVFGKAARRLH